MRQIILAIPIELLIKIIDELSLQDLKSLSLCNRRYHDKLQNFIYKVIKISWNEIDIFNDEMSSKFKYVEKLIIHNRLKESYGEWNINLLDKFGDRLPRLQIIEIRLMNSSNCLKYQKFFANNIKFLKLTTDTENSTFSMFHLKNFDKLTKIELSNFNIIRDLEEKETIHENFHDLIIRNCQWDWPFELNEYKNLTNLELQYDITNPFILGERFRNLLSENTQLSYLRILKIEIDDSKSKNLYLYPSLNLINLCNLPNLHVLILKNFKNLDFKKFYRLINQLQLNKLDLKLINNNNDLKDIGNYKLLLMTKIGKVDIEFI